VSGPVTDTIGKAIEVLARRLAGEDLVWALTGSAGHALQGADLDPRDLDVQTDEAGAYAIAALFAPHCRRPVEWRTAAAIRSHFGTLDIEGVDVEIMGAVQTRSPDGSWVEPADVRANRTFVVFRGWSVPVMSLEHEIAAYERLGRTERAEVLRSLLPSGGSAQTRQPPDEGKS